MQKKEIVPLRVCEIDRFSEGQPLHACLPFGNQTLCGYRIERKTHIALSSWGHDERLWCYKCQNAINSYGHSIPERAKQPNVVSVLSFELLRDLGKELKDGSVRDFCRRCARELVVAETGGNYCESCAIHKPQQEVFTVAGRPERIHVTHDVGPTPDFVEERILKYIEAAANKTPLFTETQNDCTC